MKTNIFTLMIVTASFASLQTASAQDDAPVIPDNWVCESDWYDDETCDCGCGVDDPVCPTGLFDICERSGCPEGQVPWEHEPPDCMRSACGDGWADEQMGEVCDDGEALDGGGCARDCQSVNVDWTCGTNAQGCESSLADEDDSDEFDSGESTSDADNNSGCSSTRDSQTPYRFISVFLALVICRRYWLVAR